MRKLLSVLSSTLQGGLRGGLLLLALLATTSLWAYDFQSGDLYYNITSNSEPYTVEVTAESLYDTYNYSGLTTATIPETVTYNGTTYNVTSIGEYAFAECSRLTSITIPNSVTSIGEWAFEYCFFLTSITIPNSVTSIGSGAFAYCSSLTSITIPNSVTSIGNEAFCDCSSLTSITIPNSVTSIGLSAFYDCSSLTSITIPNSVTSIGGNAFSVCSSLTSINVDTNNPNYCSIDGVLFNKDKTTLIQYPTGNTRTEYTIPNSVTSIGEMAFCGCSSLTSITIPNSVTSIGWYAFSGCSSLTSITIPNSVTSIGSWAFEYCSSLTTVICEAVEVPELGWDVFWYTPLSEATLYVPAESLDDYKAADQWKEFGTILPIAEAPSDTENVNCQLSTINCQKLLRNGQIIILRDGKTYNAMGQEI